MQNVIMKIINHLSKCSRKNVTDLVQEFLIQLNEFVERDDILYTVISKVMMTQEIKDSVQHVSIIGENQYKKFLSGVIEFKCKNIHDDIKKNNPAIFKKKHQHLYVNQNKKCYHINKIVSYMQVFMWHIRLVKVIYQTFFA